MGGAEGRSGGRCKIRVCTCNMQSLKGGRGGERRWEIVQNCKFPQNELVRGMKLYGLDIFLTIEVKGRVDMCPLPPLYTPLACNYQK